MQIIDLKLNNYDEMLRKSAGPLKTTAKHKYKSINIAPAIGIKRQK